MPSPRINVMMLSSVFLFGLTSHANPIPTPNDIGIVRRMVYNYAGCSADQKTRLGTAFSDAATLATNAFNIDTGSKAWSHYFRTDDDGKSDDQSKAKSVYSAVESNNDPTEPPYRFSVRCGTETTEDCKNGKSIAITDAEPQDGDTLREMLICPLFFKDTSTETNHNLSSRKFEKPKRGQDNSWCAPGNNFPWYEVAGHTLLHEMTHLDVIGKQAGLPEVEVPRSDGTTFNTHGTEDVSIPGTYPVAARALAQIWQKEQEGDGTLKPYQNAENLAAAALEWFMTDECEKNGYPIAEIPL